MWRKQVSRSCDGVAVWLGALALAMSFAEVAAAQSPPSASPPPAASPPADAAPSGATKVGGATGGYTWTEAKPEAGAPPEEGAPVRRRRARRIDPKVPQVTYPGFRMMADGGSQLTLDISRIVPVSPRQLGSHTIFHLAGADVGLRTNRFPLVTQHFPSPVIRAELQRQPGGAALVVAMDAEDRGKRTVTHRVQHFQDGSMRLVVRISALIPQTAEVGAAPVPLVNPYRQGFGCVVPIKRAPLH